MTRAAQHGWATGETVALLGGAAALIVTYFVIESRSRAPLLPLKIFRLRTLTASNVAGLLMGAELFAQFFLLTLYMQQVLHYSAPCARRSVAHDPSRGPVKSHSRERCQV
jgi:hypothetical protein